MCSSEWSMITLESLILQMKRLVYLIVGMAALFLSSCKENGEADPSMSCAVKITMSLADYSEHIYVQSPRIWVGDERVLVVDSAQEDVAVTSRPISPSAASSLFIYNMPLSKQENTLIGIYPHNAPIRIESECLKFNIPQEQDGTLLDLNAGKTIYRKGSHQGGNITLRPLYKVLNVWVDRSRHIVSKVKLTGKNGELISGEVRMDINSWESMPMSASVTVTPKRPLDCSDSRQSVAVMVADNDCKEYVAEITTVDGECFLTENVTEGYVSAEVRSYELGISQALFGSLSEGEANSLPAAGVKHLEVTMNTFWRGYTEEQCYTRARNTKKIIENTPGLEVWSVHLPFSGTLDISVLDDKARAANVETMAKMIRLAGEFKPKKLVLHPSSEPISDSDRTRRLENAKESIGKLLPIAKEVGSQLCIENLPRTCLGRTSREIMYLIQDYPDVMVCFDSNHLLIEDHDQFFRNVGNRIGAIHASDYDKVDERHWIPGKGVINWPLFLTNLMHYDYDGVFMTEVKSGTAAEVMSAYKNVICATNN